MMRKYVNPQLKIIYLEQDVLTTSGLIEDSEWDKQAIGG